MNEQTHNGCSRLYGEKPRRSRAKRMISRDTAFQIGWSGKAFLRRVVFDGDLNR